MWPNDPANLAMNMPPELRNQFYAMGPCQPLPEDLPEKSFPKDVFVRRFNHLWFNRILQDGTKVHRDWLSYSPSKNKLYCLHCILYGNNMHPKSFKAWTKNGFCTWVNGVFSINKHETCSDHILSSIKVKTSTQCMPLIPSLEYERKIQIASNRQVIAETIDIVLFLARHNLAFRGHRESFSHTSSSSSKGNFKDMVILMAKKSAVLSEHLMKIKTKGKQELSFISWERQNQIIDCISDDISLTIQKEIQACQIFSISIDSTFDFSRKEQVSFIIRYVNENTGLVYERLLAVRESASTTGWDLFELFKVVMQKSNLNWTENLIGQSYDGAANMRGEYQGLQSHIKNVNKQSTYIWCHAHRLNLVVKNIVSSNTYAVDLFNNLETLYSFIWCSKKRVAVFRENQEKLVHGQKFNKVMALKRVCTTRWSSHSLALETVLNRFDCIITSLEIIQATEGPGDAKAGSTASGLLDYLKSYRFLYTAFIFQKIFIILEPLTKMLQTKDLDLLSATTLIDSEKRKLPCLTSEKMTILLKLY